MEGHVSTLMRGLSVGTIADLLRSANFGREMGMWQGIYWQWIARGPFPIALRGRFRERSYTAPDPHLKVSAAFSPSHRRAVLKTKLRRRSSGRRRLRGNNRRLLLRHFPLHLHYLRFLLRIVEPSNWVFRSCPN